MFFRFTASGKGVQEGGLGKGVRGSTSTETLAFHFLFGVVVIGDRSKALNEEEDDMK